MAVCDHPESDRLRHQCDEIKIEWCGRCGGLNLEDQGWYTPDLAATNTETTNETSFKGTGNDDG